MKDFSVSKIVQQFENQSRSTNSLQTCCLNLYPKSLLPNSRHNGQYRKMTAQEIFLLNHGTVTPLDQSTPYFICRPSLTSSYGFTTWHFPLSRNSTRANFHGIWISIYVTHILEEPPRRRQLSTMNKEPIANMEIGVTCNVSDVDSETEWLALS